MARVRVLSLFDGISCGKLSIEDAGIEVAEYYASEVNEFSMGISKYNFPDIIQIGDVTKIDTSTLPTIDLLIGGSPCQNFSFSGTGKGAVTVEGIEVTTLEQYMELKEQGFQFEGQSYLFWEYVRILRDIKPKYFLLENVNMAEKWKNVITKTLGVEPILINSKLVSAQSRPRLYWTNIPNITQPEDKGLYIKDVLEDEYTEKEVLSKMVLDRYQPLKCSYAVGTTKPEFRKIGQRDYVYGDNNKMACLVATDYKQPKQVLHNGVIRKISPVEAERFQTLPDNYTKYGMFGEVVKEISHTKRFEGIGNGWTKAVITHIMTFLKKALEDCSEEVEEETTEDKLQAADQPLKSMEIEEGENEEMEEKIKELEAMLAEKEKESKAKDNEIMKLKAQLFDLMMKESA